MFRKFYPTRILRKRNNTNNNVQEVVVDDDYLEQIHIARRLLYDIITTNACAGLMLRLAWSDAATYSENTGDGGPNGSIRFVEEYSHPLNRGLKDAIDLCEPLKERLPRITYADLYQLAGTVAVSVAGGPLIDFNAGRTDSTDRHVFEWASLPRPSIGEPDDLRYVFYRMGFDNREIVLLSGGHTLGRAHRHNSGYEGAWTRNPWRFDNSYFKELIAQNGQLLRLRTDNILMQDNDFREFVQYYAQDENPFFEDYAIAHRRFSELGYEELMRENVTNTHLTLLVATLLALGSSLAYYNKRK